MLRHTDRCGDVKCLAGKRRALATTRDYRHAARAAPHERGFVGIEACRELHVAPEQLDPPAAAAAEIQHGAAGSHVPPNHRLELLIARAPARPNGSVALPVRVLEIQWRGPLVCPRRLMTTARHAAST